MPIPWITILKNVPWSTVIDTAPTVADGAKKLWKSVASRAQAHDEVADAAPPAASEAAASDVASTPSTAASAERRAIAALEGRVAALQSGQSELERQLLASAELINTLADQNALLIQRVEANRLRMVWLTRAGIVLAIATTIGLAFALLR